MLQSEIELFGDVLLACEMMASNGLFSVNITSAIESQIMSYHFGNCGSDGYYRNKPVRTVASGTDALMFKSSAFRELYSGVYSHHVG